METAALHTQLPFIMGLSSAALVLILILSISSSSLCILPSHYTFPALKSMCVDYACSMWSLFSRARDPILITPRNLFLLVNLIILFLFISLHLQQHAPAATNRSSRKKRQLRLTEKLSMNDKQSALLQNFQGSSPLRDLTGEEAAAMVNEALISSECVADVPENLQSEDSLSAEAASMQESSIVEAASMEESLMSGKLTPAEGSAEESPAVDSDCVNGSDVERIVLEEDGRLRLIVGNGDTDGSDDAEKIVVEEEDGQLRLMEATDGSDLAEKIVLEEDGRLRLIDRPSSCRVSSSRPLKSRSAGDENYQRVDNYDEYVNHNLNYDDNSRDKLEDDSNGIKFNEDTNNLSHNNYELDNNVNGGVPTIDCSLPQNLSNAVDASSNKKSSSRLRTSSRPIRVKKADSMDATWKAIRKGTNNASNSREHTHLIRQSSRQDFKPSRGGNGLLVRASHNNNNNNMKVRREPSISQEELNAKVESFIAKFNEQIRIQRQQSLLSYMQMVDRGA